MRSPESDIRSGARRHDDDGRTMKTRVLGLAFAATLVAGCQSASSKALSRWAEQEESSVKTVADKSTRPGPPGLPGASRRNQASSTGDSQQSLAAGEAALRQFYKDENPRHLEVAATQFEAAAAADPASAKPRHMLAIIADHQKQFTEAESHYLSAISLDPQNAAIRADLGFSYLLQEKWMQSERMLNQALQIDPGYKDAAQHLAEVYVHEGRAEMAERTLAQVMPTDQAQSRVAELMSNHPAGNENRSAQSSSSGESSSIQQDLLARMEQARRESIAARQAQAAANSPARTQTNNPFATTSAQTPPQGHPSYGSEGEMIRRQLAAIDQQGRPQQGPLMLQERQPIDTADLRGGPASMNSIPPESYDQRPFPGHSEVAQASAEQVAPQGAPFAETRTNQPAPPAQMYAGNRAVDPQGGQNPWPSSIPPEWSASPNVQNAPQAQRSPYYEETAAPRNENVSQWPSVQPGRQRQPRPTTNPMAAPEAAAPPAMAQDGMPMQATHTTTTPENGSPYASSPNTPVEASPVVNTPALQPAPETDSAPSAFEKARRAAALMGLGVGNGPTFSSLEQPTRRMSAGSNSGWNGAAFPAPTQQRMQEPPPAEQPPSSSYDAPQNTMRAEQPSFTPPPNSLGQQMPAAAPNAIESPWGDIQGTEWSSQAAPSPVTPPSYSSSDAWSHEAMKQGMQPYDASRHRVDETVHQSMNTAWGNGPAQTIPTPSSGLPIERPAAPSSQLEAWNPQTVVPAEYPGMRQPRPTQRPMTLPTVNPGAAGNSQNPQPGSRSAGRPIYPPGVDVPETYYGNR